MAFYENTILAKQDLAEKDLKTIRDKYNEIINSSSGKVIKIEDWGLITLAGKPKIKKSIFILMICVAMQSSRLLRLYYIYLSLSMYDRSYSKGK